MSWETIIGSGIAAVPPTLAAFVAWRSSRKNGARITEVHVLVNSQRDAMVKQIADLKSEIIDLRARL